METTSHIKEKSDLDTDSQILKILSDCKGTYYFSKAHTKLELLSQKDSLRSLRLACIEDDL